MACGFALSTSAPTAGAVPPPGAAVAPGAAPPPPPLGYAPGYPPGTYMMPPRVDFSTLLSGTFDVWVKNFGAFFLVFLVLSLVTGALGLLGSSVILGVPYVGGSFPLASVPSQASLIEFVAYEIVIGIIGWVLGSIVLGGVVDFSVRRYRGESVRMQDSLSKGMTRVLSIMGANLLVTLVTLGVIVLWAVLLVFGIVALASTGGTAGGIAALCGALLAFPFIGVLVVYLDIALCLYAPAIMSEGAHAIDSLQRSWTLTKGRKWSILGAGLVLFIIMILINGAIGALGTLSGNSILELVATAVASAVTGAWIAILTSVAYDRIVRLPQPSAWPPAYAPPVYPPR